MMSDDPLFSVKKWQFSRGATLPNAPSTAHGPRSAAATELRRSCALLRRSRCCDGYAQTSSVALILRVASLGRDAQNAEACIHFPPC